MTVHAITLSIDSILENAALVGVSLKAVAAHMALTEEDCIDLEICVVEAVNNVIIHAYGRAPGGVIEVHAQFGSTDYCIDIIDEGRAIANWEPPRLEFDSEDIEALPEGGMGLFLIHSVMDEVSYSSDQGKNKLTMRRWL